MKEYHKIQTVYERDPATNHKTLLEGEFSLPAFEYLQGNMWTFTEKVDGMNIRVMWDGKAVKFGGKTDNAQLPPFLLSKLEAMFHNTALLTEVFGVKGEVCLYGEGYGAKIQKGGGNYREDQSFVLFDVKAGDWWLQREDVEDVAIKLEIDTVPIISTGNLYCMTEMARLGFESQWGDFRAEGIVARPETELKTRSGHRVITKIKCRDFKSTEGMKRG